MNRTFDKQLEQLNAAALDFGTLGYHVEVSIYGKVKSAVMTIYYDKKSEKKKLLAILSLYQEKGDVIEHQTFPKVETFGRTFYTMKLRKEPQDVQEI